jgi:Brp/Blh family beta-carotene 15,15'-monooxygenase
MEVFRVQRLLDRWRDRMLFVVVASIALILRGNAQFVLLGLGLVTLGVTHGAVDHELDPSSRESKLFFFSIYCSGIVAFFALWWGKPGVALWIFIFYSAGHFGECQWKQTYARLPSTFTELALARIWGLFAAIFAPAYHLDQALPILRLILRDPHLNLSFSIRDAQLFSFALAGAAVISILVFEARGPKPLRWVRHCF